MSRILGFIFLVILAIVVISFTTLNAQSIHLNYYFGETEIPLALAVVIAIAGGILFGFIASFGMMLKLKRENRKLKKSAKNAEKELVSLKAAPTQHSH
jgi:putative membrane protein